MVGTVYHRKVLIHDLLTYLFTYLLTLLDRFSQY